MKNNYFDSVHFIGRWGTVGAIVVMAGIPLVISAVYGIWPTLEDVMKTGAGLMAIYVPVAVSEVFSFTPTLGSSCYITFITGNVMNLKLPCAINAMELAEASQGTDEGDAVASVAVTVSSMVTMLVLALGVLLLVPIQPILAQPAVRTATSYMLPALFGGMFLNMLLSRNAGDYTIDRKWLVILPPILVAVFVNLFLFPIAGKEGYSMLVAIPATILSAYVLYKMGAVHVAERTPPGKVPEACDVGVEE